MTCKCHGDPMRFVKDSRYTAGGFWRCSTRVNAAARERYDTDPVYRLKKVMDNNRRSRHKLLVARRARLREA